ncbi:sugar (pentulose or hexulose) kinase [Cricetibacter osteomyelitidis]|uniref:Sugar (Pentulose or hexulose) kinase n=1 Tax=Cricetibacter osteomyelitidis TaxID=1521931 RepID=A0A4V2T1U9_9PAST|nr:FGGY-family carbohydrate kinase [Cricetibacter osteomyelitidis]TCP94943.1 sugar (pentulose or hexulose) kinase [Cricetibacter osteomyelitidis]
MQNIKQIIEEGDVFIGIEFGSTRIKSVLIDAKGNILAKGEFEWENHLIDGIWTYPQEEIWQGLQSAYADLGTSVKKQYNTVIRNAKAIGISGMMHGYMPFDKEGSLLTPFRTWRNNITSKSSEKLTALFQYNIPQRWSIAHLYQAVLNQEKHVSEIDFLTTLAGYIHWKLTDEKVLGIGEASGMFPIDIQAHTFNQTMLKQFEQLVSELNYPWKIHRILPKVLNAGEYAGVLTESGAKLIDPSGQLQAGIPLCPPEGDAGTGMVATNSIKEKTGNISAGTSAFAMIVLEKDLSKVYEQLDMVTTPAGKLVAMAHSNNCTSDINAWMGLFGECLASFGMNISQSQLYETLFTKALEGEDNCGNLLAYGFYSGEHGVGLAEGCPTFLHPMNANFNLANFIRVHLYTAFGAMKLGVDILLQQEQVKIQQILAHGGIFKTKGVAQKILASALNVPIAVTKSAGEGGAWGIALLANYLTHTHKSLEAYLDEDIFSSNDEDVVYPDVNMVQGYNQFIKRYSQGVSIVQEAVNTKISTIS